MDPAAMAAYGTLCGWTLNDRDYKALKAAVDSGEIEAETGL
jgi:hypothetical protein